MRLFVVSRQRTVAKTQTEIVEGNRDQSQRIPEGVPGEYRCYRGDHWVGCIVVLTIIDFSANLQDDTAVHNRRLCGRPSRRQPGKKQRRIDCPA